MVLVTKETARHLLSDPFNGGVVTGRFPLYWLPASPPPLEGFFFELMANYTGGNESAFPREFGVVDYGVHGLTKREWLAGLAMQGIMANPSFTTNSPEDIAAGAIEQADALIEELNKSTEK